MQNLVLALGASLLVVLVIVLLVPRSDTPMERDIDVAAVAEQAQVASDDPLAVPESCPRAGAPTPPSCARPRSTA